MLQRTVKKKGKKSEDETKASPAQAPDDESRSGVNAYTVVRKAKALTITSGNDVFAPVEYQSFRLNELTLHFELSEDDDVDTIVEQSIRWMRDVQLREFRARVERHKQLTNEAIR